MARRLEVVGRTKQFVFGDIEVTIYQFLTRVHALLLGQKILHRVLQLSAWTMYFQGHPS